jgi:hypothetical protein
MGQWDRLLQVLLNSRGRDIVRVEYWRLGREERPYAEYVSGLGRMWRLVW